jgi:hypothetical protein
MYISSRRSGIWTWWSRQTFLRVTVRVCTQWPSSWTGTPNLLNIFHFPFPAFATWSVSDPRDPAVIYLSDVSKLIYSITSTRRCVSKIGAYLVRSHITFAPHHEATVRMIRAEGRAQGPSKVIISIFPPLLIMSNCWKKIVYFSMFQFF